MERLAVCKHKQPLVHYKHKIENRKNILKKTREKYKT